MPFWISIGVLVVLCVGFVWSLTEGVRMRFFTEHYRKSIQLSRHTRPDRKQIRGTVKQMRLAGSLKLLMALICLVMIVVVVAGMSVR